MSHLFMSRSLMETPGQVNLPPSVRQGAMLRVKVWGAGVRGSGRASDGLGVAAGAGAGAGRAQHPELHRQSCVDERLATVRLIDFNKNLLRYSYDSTFLRSHCLHPHPYHPGTGAHGAFGVMCDVCWCSG
eukprot:COSAG01_NODE_12991_length_1652_cov_2.010303_2_plen_130_part_00